MVVQGLKYPLGVYLTDAAGLRYQALMIAGMLPVKVGLSWALAGRMGAAGPVLASIVCVACFELLANAWYVRRTLRTRPAGPAGDDDTRAGRPTAAVGSSEAGER
jgi:hypothetical protein